MFLSQDRIVSFLGWHLPRPGCPALEKAGRPYMRVPLGLMMWESLQTEGLQSKKGMRVVLSSFRPVIVSDI